MIYLEDRFGEKYYISDDFKIGASNKTGLKLIQMAIEELRPFKPENGSPTLLLIELLKKYNFKVLDYELPIDEQIEGTIF